LNRDSNEEVLERLSDQIIELNKKIDSMAVPVTEKLGNPSDTNLKVQITKAELHKVED
jgi:hypothetical protein